MKIVYVSPRYFPHLYGGGIVYAYNLVTAIIKMGHQAKVFCADMPYDGKAYQLKREKVGGVEVTRVNIKYLNILAKFLPYFIYYNPPVARVFKDYLLEDKPDIVHFHTPLDLGVSLVSIPKQLGISTVATLHEGWWICRQGFFNNTIYTLACNRRNLISCIRCVADFGKVEKFHKIKYSFRLLRSIIYTPIIDSYIYKHLNEIDLLIPPSSFLTNKYIDAGIKREKIINIRYGIDTEIFKRTQRAVSKKIRFGFFGGTNYRIKGFGILIEAFRKINHKDKFSLDIWGDIEEEVAKDAIEKSPGLDIKFHNRFTREQILEVFSSLDVLIIPSLVLESCSLVILEAFAAGVPVIAVNAGGIPELLREGENGLLFNFGDADDLAEKIKKILDRRALIGEFASQIKPVKSIEENAEEIVKVYARLL